MSSKGGEAKVTKNVTINRTKNKNMAGGSIITTTTTASSSTSTTGSITISTSGDTSHYKTGQGMDSTHIQTGGSSSTDTKTSRSKASASDAGFGDGSGNGTSVVGLTPKSKDRNSLRNSMANKSSTRVKKNVKPQSESQAISKAERRARRTQISFGNIKLNRSNPALNKTQTDNKLKECDTDGQRSLPNETSSGTHKPTNEFPPTKGSKTSSLGETKSRKSKDDVSSLEKQKALNSKHDMLNSDKVSHDRVWRIVQEEGRSARNLIAYNLPATDDLQHNKTGAIKPLPRSPRKKSVNTSRDMSPSVRRADDSSSVKSSSSRPASSQGSCITRKTDVRARYWAFLFDNLKRAVDEIYQTCETDESVDECKEVIMILQQCTKDFKSLINQWNVIKAFEHLEESGQRPASLAWEVRKTSPGKLHLTMKDATSPSPAQLFSPGRYNKHNNMSDLGSWADLVRGPVKLASELEEEQLDLLRSVQSPQPPTEVPPLDAHKPEAVKPSEAVKIDDVDIDDSDGWETVRRSRSKTSPLSKASSGSKGSLCSNGNSKFEKTTPKNSNSETKKHSETKKPEARKTNSQPNSAKKSNPVSAKLTNSQGKGNSYRDAVVKSTVSKSPQMSDKARVSRKLNLDISDAISTTNFTYDMTNSVKNESNTEHEKSAVNQPLGLKLDLPSTTDDSENEEYLTMELEQALNGALQDEAWYEKEAAIESAIKEEQSYLLEIEQAENEEIPRELVGDEDDDEGGADRGDGLDNDPELESTGEGFDSMSVSATSMDWESLMARYEAEAERRKALGLSWADIDETESRTPGRGAHMHEKLSSPSRKRSINESRKRHEEKQAKAAELRRRYQQEKAERIKDLTKKVEEVRLVKEDLLMQKKEYLSRKLQEAEEKRQQQLMMIVKKAHEEENKANEIAFINTLSEQNKKMDILTKHQDVEARLQDIQEERQRKIGEKAAKDAAVEERRRALDAERQARLTEMQIKRKKREEEIEQKNIERDKERHEALKAKEREHKDRLAQLEKQQQANIEELQKKIEQKQSESARRHNEQLQSKREKAFIMYILKHSTEDHNEVPKLEPYDTKKMCTVCNMVIPSELHLQSHLRGQQHQKKLEEVKGQNGVSLSKDEIENFNLEHIQDVPGDFVDPKQISNKERSRSMRKRCKKLRQRMLARGNEFEAGLDLRQETVDSPNKAKLSKLIKDVNKFLLSQEKGPWPQNKISSLDRCLGEMTRVLDRKISKDQLAFRVCGGLNTLTKLLQILNDDNIRHQYQKSWSNACQVIRLASKSCIENSHYLLFSNRIGTMIDLLMSRLMVTSPDCDSSDISSLADSYTFTLTANQPPVDDDALSIDPCATSILHTLSIIFSSLGQQNRISSDRSTSRPGMDAFISRNNDVVSYVTTVGVVDNLQTIFSSINGPLDNNVLLFPFLQYSINFLTTLTKLAAKRSSSLFESPQKDCTSLMKTFEDIELAGIMSLLYGVLLHNVPARCESTNPPELSANTLTITLVGLKLINQMAVMDYKLVQRVLGAEGVSLELRHITSYLIWYCCHYKNNEELLHEVILCVGYFVVLNADNQRVVQSGQSPTILQQLCSLPFQYFSDARHVSILFPTLIACCFNSTDNTSILEQELSSHLLANYLEETLLEQEKQRLIAQKRPSTSTNTIPSESRMSLSMRFPSNMWNEAKDFFSQT